MSEKQSSTAESDAAETQHFLSRRTALTLLGVGGMGALAGGATAQSGGSGSSGAIYDWQQDVDANGQALKRLGTLDMAANAPITSFTGNGLSINDEGELFAHPSPDVSTDAEGGGTGIVVKEARNIVAGAGLVARESAPGEATLDVDLGPIDADTLDGHDAADFVMKTDDGGDSTGAMVAGLSEQQVVNDGESVVVAFDDVDVDESGEFDTDTHSFTAARDGLYHVDVHLMLGVSGSADATFFMRLEKESDGGTETVGYSEVGTAKQTPMSYSRVMRLQADDTLRVRFSISGKDVAIVDFNQRASVLSIHQIS